MIDGHDDPQAAADYTDVEPSVRSPTGAWPTPGGSRSRASRSSAGRPSRRAVAARAALWSGDRAGAAADLEAIDETGVHGPAAEMRRATIRAGIAALDGRTGEAIALFRVARDGFRDIGLPWEEALVGIDMATLLDAREPEVMAAAARSREILTGLARPALPRQARGGVGSAPGEPARAGPRPTEAADRAAV